MTLYDITDDQIDKFCNEFNCELVSFQLLNIDKNEFCLKMYHVGGSLLKFKLTEKKCIGIGSNKNYNLTSEWLTFYNNLKQSLNIDKNETLYDF